MNWDLSLLLPTWNSYFLQCDEKSCFMVCFFFMSVMSEKINNSTFWVKIFSYKMEKVTEIMGEKLIYSLFVGRTQLKNWEYPGPLTSIGLVSNCVTQWRLCAIFVHYILRYYQTNFTWKYQLTFLKIFQKNTLSFSGAVLD